ncbi:MAG TPA: hypothetical protein VKQ72_09380, partial [Aggregatilineales bacterium]|nr:hypothetical protein [Aggregatilineales bacterium]
PLWLALAVTTSDEIRVESGDATKLMQHGSVVTERGDTLQGPEAFKAVAAHLLLSRFWLWTLRSSFVYRKIEGTLRWWMCRTPLVPDVIPSNVRATPSRALRRVRAVGKVTLVLAEAGLLFLLVWWNGRELQINNVYLVQPELPSFAYPILNYTDLYQNWGMFAPSPSRREGSIIVEGKFGFGPVLDLRTLRDPSTESEVPHWVMGPDLAWRKIDEVLYIERPAGVLQDWALHYCNVYNNNPPTSKGRLEEVDLIYRYHWIPAYNEPPQQGLSDDRLLSYRCP